MPSVSGSIQIAASPAAVWALLSDPARYPEWVAGTDRMVEVPADGLAPGASYTEYAGIAPFKSESRWTVTEFEPHRRQVHLGDDGSVAMELTIEIAPVTGGSHLTQTLALRPRGAVAILNLVAWPLVLRRRARRGMEQTVGNAKLLVEAGGA